MGPGSAAIKGQGAMKPEMAWELTLEAGPLLVFGGPCSNLQGLRAVRAEAEARGIPPQRVICTGDLVAYCGDPAPCVAEIRDWGCYLIGGNMERQLAENALDCGCGFGADSACDRLSGAWFAHVDAQIEGADRQWMAGLPDLLHIDWMGRRVLVLHGAMSAVNRFIWSTDPDDLFEAELAQMPGPRPDIVLAGHSGLPFQRVIGGSLWLNAGATGLPPNDGAPALRYAVIDSDGKAEIHALPYDFEAAAQAMERAGLVQGYHSCLRDGVWPSEDILPLGLRRG
jgi:predicted phosphodiesterase